MQHLVELNLVSVFLPSNFYPSYFWSLSAGLTRLSLLRTLVISCYGLDLADVVAATTMDHGAPIGP